MKSVQTIIHVIQGNNGSLLSYRTACNLGLIHMTVKHICGRPRVCDMLVQNYPKLFEGIGKLKNAEVTSRSSSNTSNSVSHEEGSGKRAYQPGRTGNH